MSLIEINWRPDRRDLRIFGAVCAVAAGALGAWLFFKQTFFGCGVSPSAARLVAAALWALAAVCLVLSLSYPRGLRPLYLALAVVSLPIGLVVSYVALAILYYLVLSPTGLVLRLLGRDFLGLKFQRGMGSYWVRHKPVEGVRRYFRQY